MKKTIYTIILMAGYLFASAQTETGDWMVGGSFRLNTGDNNTTIGLTPNAGVFIIRNLAIGGNIGFDYSKLGNNKTTDFRIGPFTRYYF